MLSLVFERILCALCNNNVINLNKKILNRMSGDEKSYFSADKVLQEAGADTPNDFKEQPIPIEVLREMNDLGNIPPGELTLKIGCPLILL